VRRSALLVVCLAVFVDMLGFGVILPALPFRAAHLGGGGGWVGAVLTAYAAAQFVSAPILGGLSDRYGRRRILLLSLVGSTLCLALAGWAPSLGWLLAVRALAGGFGGSIAVGQAYAVDLSSARERTQALGLVGASIGLGFVVGPAIGGALAAAGLGFAGICLVAAGIAAVNLALGLRLLPVDSPLPAATVPRPPAPRSPARTAGALLSGRLAGLREGLSLRGLRPVLLAAFSTTAAFAGMETTFALLGRDRFGIGPAGIGAVFAGVGVVLAAVQGGLVGRLSRRYGDRNVAVAGALLLAAGLVIVPTAPAWLAYLSLGLVGAAQGLLTTTTAALVTAIGAGETGVGAGTNLETFHDGRTDQPGTTLPAADHHGTDRPTGNLSAVDQPGSDVPGGLNQGAEPAVAEYPGGYRDPADQTVAGDIAAGDIAADRTSADLPGRDRHTIGPGDPGRAGSPSALASESAANPAEPGPRRTGGVLGVAQSANAAARVVGPLVAGFAFDLGHSVPYVVGGLACVGAVALLSELRPEASAPDVAGNQVDAREVRA
jgi:DHA1 family tetracycline resistance protein-like MFS transporter